MVFSFFYEVDAINKAHNTQNIDTSIKNMHWFTFQLWIFAW